MMQILKAKDLDQNKIYFCIVQEYERYGGSPWSTFEAMGREILKDYTEEPYEEFGVKYTGLEGLDEMLRHDNGEDVMEIYELPS